MGTMSVFAAFTGQIYDILNMKPLDMSVNRSLGAQIQNAIKSYPDGTVFGQFTIH